MSDACATATLSSVCRCSSGRRIDKGRPILLTKPRPSHPVGAVKRAILDGFADVTRIDFLPSFEISECATDFENAVIRARREPQPREGRFEQRLGRAVDRTVIADETRRHLSIAINLLDGE